MLKNPNNLSPKMENAKIMYYKYEQNLDNITFIGLVGYSDPVKRI